MARDGSALYDPRVIRIDSSGSWRFPPHSARLDSAAGVGSPYSRWSYRLGPPIARLFCSRPETGARLIRGSGEVQNWDDPLQALASLEASLPPGPRTEPGPPFQGGWVGFLSYDLGRLFEPVGDRAADDLSLPLFDFNYHASLDARDAEGRIFHVDHDAPAAASALPVTIRAQPHVEAPLASNFTRESYCAAVARAIEWIRAGDIFQVNLSQRFTAGLAGRQPAELYQDLIRRHPAWFAAYLPAEDYCLLSHSPELFLRVEQLPSEERRIITRPIKGTRPRGPDQAEQLRRSDKDQAELNMIIDLGRNDLGRVCQIGSVRVSEPRTIEAHPGVYHGVATVEGRLLPDVDLLDLLRATFPGGSVTGAPKIRAMQIIDQLEPVRRGPYCGAIGYVGVGGQVEFNLAIRTLIVSGGKVHFSVGGGIVADSEPEAEFRETMDKASAILEVLRAFPEKQAHSRGEH